MTLLLEIHGWRGLSAAGGPLLYLIIAGFFTVGFSPFQITKRLAELTQALRGMVRK